MRDAALEPHFPGAGRRAWLGAAIAAEGAAQGVREGRAVSTWSISKSLLIDSRHPALLYIGNPYALQSHGGRDGGAAPSQLGGARVAAAAAAGRSAALEWGARVGHGVY